jgi:hypothetical protein
VFSRGDEDKMVDWLAEQVCPSELNTDRQREAVLARCRADKLEPPGRTDRIIGAANRIADARFCAVTMSRLPDVAAALRSIIAEPDDDTEDEEDSEEGCGELSLFTELKTDPGKLGRVRAIGLPDGLFADVAEKRITRWRARGGRGVPVDAAPRPPTRGGPDAAGGVVLVPADRADRLAGGAVLRPRAERRVDKEQIAEFRRVGDKQNVLFTVAGAAVEHPDDTVQDAVYPVVGEQTLKDLVAEAEATESRRRARVRTVLTGSYSHYYRVMLPKLLDALEFRCNNTVYRPVMDAIDLLHRYKDRDGRLTHYERADRVPIDGVVKAEWRAAVVDERGRVERVSYELCVLGALRDAIRRREVGGRRR